MNVSRVIALAALLTACGSSAPPERQAITLPLEPSQDPGQAEAVERWVSGTPTFVYGEGYIEEHRVSVNRDGPWHTAALQLPEGMILESGQVHRIRMTVRDTSGRMDGPATEFEVLEVLESRPGGPPTAVYPGMSVAGISVEDAPTREGVTWGPFRFAEEAIEFRLAEVGSILVGGRTFGPDASLPELAAAFEGCEPVEESAEGYRCHGAQLRARGAQVEVSIASDS